MFSELVAVIVLCIGLLLIFFMLSRKLHRRLASFTSFIFLFVVRDTVALFILHTPFGQGLGWTYTYWTSELVLSAL